MSDELRKVFLRDEVYDSEGTVIGFIQTPATLWVHETKKSKTYHVTLDPPLRGGYELLLPPTPTHPSETQ